jgi:hypothetical protein
MYHPAAALYDASLKETLFHDFQILKKLLEKEETLYPDAPKSVESSEKKQTLEKWV